MVDLVCGLLAVVGIQAALAERERTGRGRHVEVSLMDAALMSLLNQGSAWVLGGVVPQRRGNRHPSITPYETFECADRPLAVAVGNDRLFARLCAALGLPDLPADERFATNSARVAHADELAVALEPVLRTRPAAEWAQALRAAAVPAGPINDVAEAFALAESLAMEPVREAGGYTLPTPPLRLDGERPAIRRPPPRLDEHGDELREWLRSSSASGRSPVKTGHGCPAWRSERGPDDPRSTSIARLLPDDLRQHEADVLAQHLELGDVLVPRARKNSTRR